MRRSLARTLEILLHVQDSPHRLALSFAIGVWIAFNPLLGVHTAMALGLAFALRLSRAAMLLGAYVNNPWTLAPLYGAGTYVGCLLLGVSPAGLGHLRWSGGGTALWAALKPFLWPFVVGNLVLGVAAALPSYFVLRTLLERRRGTPEAPGR
ncbi:MAG TPA: DUF2062 domain-containing protein [Vicinamibacteria bacterium]|nr:DUF2062 domain-containing protein [Vicinamibacteria bacterium]